MGDLLDQLNDPKEVQSFSLSKLGLLAQECRNRIIDVVSRTGGHLASSLGTVELTIALAKVFDFKKDRVIWDVGHQAYTYKILTGRNDRFELLGKKKGLSKFLSRKESEYDHFGAGHASTSISAALGFASARKLKGEDFYTIAVIGDGAMTGGLAFEALNHAGHLDENLIVILNDNEMSIDPVVGALSKTVINISSTKTFNLVRGEILKHGEKALPKSVLSTLKRANESFMAFFTKGVFFEKLNFTYFGQIKGHNLQDLVAVLKVCKDLKGPILIHVSTQKGKGYSPAEGDSLTFHGVGAFEPESGKFLKKQQQGLPFTEVWSKTFDAILEADPKVVGISAAMLANTGLAPLEQKYPGRIFDVGIAEGHAVTFAAGLAAEGIKPFVVIYSTFLQRAIDHIAHDVALQKLPVRFILDRAGFVGPDGATHHGVMDLTYLRMIPNLVIMAPRDGVEMQSMIRLAWEYDQGPIALRFPRGNTNCYQDGDLAALPKLTLGKGELLRKGKDLALLAVGSMVDHALEVAERLAKIGYSAKVINARFIKPLDKNLILEQCQGVDLVACLEENVKAGGFGSAVMELFVEEGLTHRMLLFGVGDQFYSHATAEEQLQATGLDVESIFHKVKDRLEELKSCKKSG